MVGIAEETRQPENDLKRDAFAIVLVACECAGTGYLSSMPVDEFCLKKLSTSFTDHGL